jgi:hypothetical protein
MKGDAMKPVKNIRLVIAAAKKAGRILEPLKAGGVVYGYKIEGKGKGTK